RSVRVDRSVERLMCIDRYEMDIAPIERIVATLIGRGNTFHWNRVNRQIRHRVRHFVVVIAGTWEKRSKTHRCPVVVEVISLIRIVGAARVVGYSSGVYHEGWLLCSEPLSDQTLSVTARIAPPTIPKNQEIERPRTGRPETCRPCGGDILAVDVDAVYV